MNATLSPKDLRRHYALANATAIECDQCSKPQTYDGSGLCSWRCNAETGSCDGKQQIAEAPAIIRIFFSNIEYAVTYAKAKGGWIAQCEDGSIQWFAPDVYTMTPIMVMLMKEGRGDAEIGPWPMFDHKHPSHTTVSRGPKP